jgi:Flp pilus assembly protein TadD
MRILTGFWLALTMAIGSLALAGCSSLPQMSDLVGATTTPALASGPPPTAPVEPRPQTDVNRVDGMLRLAADIEGRGERGTALTFYERAASNSNGDPGVHLRVGDAFLRLGYPINAANAYQVVLAKEPENPQALLGLGTALAKSERLEEGLPYLARAAPLVNTASAYDRLGVAHVMAGQPREALASFEQAHSMDERDPDIATNLALAAALAGQHDRAVSLMKSVADRPGAAPHHKRNLVLVMGIAGRGAEARQSARDLPAETVDSLLNHAKSIRGLSNPKARAAALGTASTETR